MEIKMTLLKKLLIILIFFSTMTAFGQSNATTDDGKKVKLNSDGTWEFVEEITTPSSSVFIGGKKLISGVKTTIHNEEFGYETSISIAKDGEKTIIIFWQETPEKQMNFFNWLWTGTVTLYLENGETISLIDRNMKGQNKITNGYSGRFDIKSDLYQRFASYYLTPSECFKLKTSNLYQIAYKTTDISETGTTYLKVTENNQTAKEQLLAIKR